MMLKVSCLKYERAWKFTDFTSRYSLSAYQPNTNFVDQSFIPRKSMMGCRRLPTFYDSVILSSSFLRIFLEGYGRGGWVKSVVREFRIF